MTGNSQRIIYIVLIVCLIFSGCLRHEPEPDPYPSLTRVWADPDESSITLQWKYEHASAYLSTPNSQPATQLVEPKQIEVYFGESPTELSLYRTLEKTDTLLQFPGLITGKPYYFEVRLITDTFYSHTRDVTAVPGKYNPLKRIRLPKDISTFRSGQPIFISYFPDTTKLLVGYGNLDGGTYLHNLKTDRWVKLSEQKGYPAWDWSGNKVAIGKDYADFGTTPAFIDIFPL